MCSESTTPTNPSHPSFVDLTLVRRITSQKRIAALRLLLRRACVLVHCHKVPTVPTVGEEPESRLLPTDARSARDARACRIYLPSFYQFWCSVEKLARGLGVSRKSP